MVRSLRCQHREIVMTMPVWSKMGKVDEDEAHPGVPANHSKEVVGMGLLGASLWSRVCSLCGQRADVQEQLAAVVRTPLPLNHLLHLVLQQRRVHLAAYLQHLCVHTKKADFRSIQ